VSDDDPLSDVADEVARRAEDEDGEADVFETAFREVDVETDDEDVWAQLTGDAGAVETVEDGSERVVDKRHYCHRCEHFADPPQMRCTHDGTEILELVDTTNVRVVDCPVVRERAQLEDDD
jgi:hypothetical protein